jgi:hypothetical protein
MRHLMKQINYKDNNSISQLSSTSVVHQNRASKIILLSDKFSRLYNNQIHNLWIQRAYLKTHFSVKYMST